MSSINTFAKRLSTVIQSVGDTNYSLAKKAGLPRGLLDKAIRGNKLISIESLTKIIICHPQIDVNWLLTGRGQMFLGESHIDSLNLDKSNFTGNPKGNLDGNLSPEKSVKSGLKQGLNIQTGPPLVVTVDSQGRENISLVSAKAFAGYASSLHEPTYLTTLPTFRLPFPEFLNATFRAFQVSGPSMEPTLYNGEWLIGQFVENWPQSIREGYIYIIVTTETVLVKRVLNRISVRNQVVIQSDNESFPTDFLEPEQIREMWYLKAKIGFQFPNPRYDIHRKIANLEADVETLRRQLSGESNN
jgi:phage repressor protein C with HTH and peptisase S24 domain